MRVDFPCCNPGWGCPHCFCIKCCDDGKLPECSKIKDKPHVKISLLCQHCLKGINDICYPHYWSSLVDMREIKLEKLKDPEDFINKRSEIKKQWEMKYKKERSIIERIN